MAIPQNLEALFNGLRIVEDTDGDGYPDHVALKIMVTPDMNDPFVWAGVMNLAARLAFEVVGLNLPLVVKGTSLRGAPRLVVYAPGHRGPCALLGDLPAAWTSRPSGTVHLCGASGRAMGETLNALAAGVEQDGSREVFDDLPKNSSRTIDLLDLSCVYETLENNPRSRMLKALFSLPEQRLDCGVGVALSCLVARLALDATELTLPLAFVGEPQGSGTVFKVCEGTTGPGGISLPSADRAGRKVILFSGSPDILVETISSWSTLALSTGGEGLESVDAFREHIKGFRRLLGGSGYFGQWARFLLDAAAGEAVLFPGAMGKRWAALCRACRVLSLPLPPEIKPPQAIRRRSRWKSETDVLIDIVRRLPAGQGRVTGTIFVSKPEKRRNKLKVRVEEILDKLGYEPRIRVLNAYKPGLCWLLEDVLPRLKKLKGVDTVRIRYRPFEREGALEMRSRWLQEMFPGPDLLAASLSLPQEKINIQAHPGMESTYEVEALDGLGKTLLSENLSPLVTRLAYLPGRPEAGFIHPATGGALLANEGRILLDRIVPTDRERFWKVFQERWLPLVEKSMIRRLKEENGRGQPAFWEEISIQVSMEEDDLRLSIGEERVAPMEALHEDIYFVFLRFFSFFTERHPEAGSIHLGKILPKVSFRPGGPHPSASFKAKPLAWHPSPGDDLQGRLPAVSAAGVYRGRWWFRFDREEHADSARFVDVARTWSYKVDQAKDGGLLLWLKPPQAKSGKQTGSMGFEPPADLLLKAREVDRILRRLGRCRYLHVWRISRTLNGRPIHAVEAFSAGGAELPSIPKLRLLKPSFLFNARHHANEISSTNAALRSAWHLGGTARGRDSLKHVNAVWIPIENADGVATFEELLPTGDDYMLHAARYNALGVEFYQDYFELPPRFPEAGAKTRLWRRWLPEIVVDHHGVPNHEWVQPFSGYAPVNFQEFWIPRNFVYVCIPFVDEDNHRHHRAALRLARLLCRAMSGEPEIADSNRELACRYRRYAWGPDSAVFPPSAGEPLLVLPPLGRTRDSNFAVRCPDVTVSEIVVEVPDEVTTGNNLAMCVLAHQRIEDSLLESFRRAPGGILRFRGREAGSVHLKWVAGEDVSFITSDDMTPSGPGRLL